MGSFLAFLLQYKTVYKKTVRMRMETVLRNLTEALNLRESQVVGGAQTLEETEGE